MKTELEESALFTSHYTNTSPVQDFDEQIQDYYKNKWL